MSTAETQTTIGQQKARMRGLLRVAGYLTLLTAALLLWTARAAYADLEHTVLRLGETLVSELGPSFVGEPQGAVFNGQPVFLGATVTPLSVHQVLDGFANNCNAGTRDIRSLLGVRGERLLLEEPAESRWLRALDQARVLRTESDSEGMLSCFASKRQQNVSSLVANLSTLLESGDVSRLGDLRYVRAQRQASGKTQVIAVWTEGRFELSSIFPERGDVPGSDMADVPRPPAATRSVCATAPQRSFAYRLYESGQPAAEVLSFYEGALVQTGWSKVQNVHESADAQGIRAYRKAGRALGIGVEPHPDGSQVSLVDLGQVAHAPALR